MTKQEIKEREEQLLAMARDFCAQNLDNDYLLLCEKLIKKLGRKRDVPFQRGKPEIWAAAVVYALGSINFLFDKSFEPYMTADQICEYFGTKNSSVASKAREIKDMLKMGHFDPEFSTQKMAESNPLHEMIVVDGLIVPLKSLPQDIQIMVRQARANGQDVQLRTK